MRTIAYVDGFNLYYGCLKGTPYRWLDLPKLIRLLLPQHQIVEVKYFSALIKPRPNDVDQALRQQIYLRALRTLPNVTVILGHYLSHKVMMPLAYPQPGQSPFVRVVKTEEKGSDVNIATHLIHDAHQGAFETAVVVSNDSDLLEPVRIVHRELGLPVGVINPQKRPSQVLIQQATFYKKIREGVLAASQLSPGLVDQHGEIRKPVSW